MFLPTQKLIHTWSKLLQGESRWGWNAPYLHPGHGHHLGHARKKSQALLLCTFFTISFFYSRDPPLQSHSSGRRPCRGGCPAQVPQEELWFWFSSAHPNTQPQRHPSFIRVLLYSHLPAASAAFLLMGQRRTHPELILIPNSRFISQGNAPALEITSRVLGRKCPFQEKQIHDWRFTGWGRDSKDDPTALLLSMDLTSEVSDPSWWA